MFKRNLFKECQEYWSKNLNKNKFDCSVGNKLSLYSEELKNEVRFKSYRDLIKNVKTRVAVTNMRISCHLLPIESGRYMRLYPEFKRLCPLCNRSKIGDEFHYLLNCTHSSLSHIRAKRFIREWKVGFYSIRCRYKTTYNLFCLLLSRYAK